MREEILTYKNKISKGKFYEIIDWHKIIIIFRTHWERSFIPLFIHSLSSHAWFISLLKYRGENFVKEEIKIDFVWTEAQCVHCWLKACSWQKESGFRVIHALLFRTEDTEQSFSDQRWCLWKSQGFPCFFLWSPLTGWNQVSRAGTYW